MMDQREKIIKLLSEHHSGSYDEALLIADFLIANGVVVLPCKIGDEVYYTFCNTVQHGVCHTITIHDKSIQVHLYDFDGDNVSVSADNVEVNERDKK